MKILFDLTATQADHEVVNHGGSEYAKAVFCKLIESAPDQVVAFYNQNLELDDNLSCLLKKYSVDILIKSDIDSILAYIIEKGINIFYTSLARTEYHKLIEMQSESFKVIITIHGLRPLELPSDKYEWYYSNSVKSKLKFIYKHIFPTFYKNSLLKNYRKILSAYKIITVSNHSKHSLLKFFPELKAEIIHVCYSPLIDYSNDSQNLNDTLNRFPVSTHKYFLLLSGSIWTKNSYRAIKAFDKIISDNTECKDYKMVITGLKRISFKVRNTENFVFTDYLNRGLLEKLIRNSLALIYPTLNEGFGYPPLEAMKYGVPVYASGIPSVQEVCGDAAIYIDPTNKNDIRNKLLSAINSKDSFSEANIQKRYNRYKLIKDRQEDDLIKLIMLLQGLETDSNQEVIRKA